MHIPLLTCDIPQLYSDRHSFLNPDDFHGKINTNRSNFVAIINNQQQQQQLPRQVHSVSPSVQDYHSKYCHDHNHNHDHETIHNDPTYAL